MSEQYNLSSQRAEEIANSYLRARSRRERSLIYPELTSTDHARLSQALSAFHGNARLQSALGSYLRESNRENRLSDLEGLLGNLKNVVDHFEVQDNQNLALDQIPEQVYTDMETILSSTSHNPPIDPEDALAIALVRWFKTSFMQWVDPVKCPKCHGTTEGSGTLLGNDITSMEKTGGAGRVEIYNCIEIQKDGTRGCKGTKRFPRYNNVKTLMHTREGRCGEYANLFNLFLRAVGLEGRYVWNSEDHVWNEYWSDALGHWVHLDSCEGSWNQPLLYELGWGKKQAYCIAVGRHGVEDVTRCYADDWMSCWERRRRFDEQDLARVLQSTTTNMRSILSSEQRQRLATNDHSQAQWASDGRLRRLAAQADDSARQGRQSGTADWRAVRKELRLDTNQQSHRTLKRGKVIFSLRESSLLLHTSGSAAIVQSEGQPPHISLTPCATSRCGSAFAPPWKFDGQSFISDVTFRISKSDRSAQGADGMAFVCLLTRHGIDTALLGGDGAGLGYSGLGQAGDWAVEIDTYRSQDSCADPPTPHISLHCPPNPHHRYAVACTAVDCIPDISDSSWRTITIQYEANTRTITTWLTIDDDITKSSKNHIMDKVLLWQATLPSSVQPASTGVAYRLGLTAATGGFAQAHEVQSWITYVAQ